MAKTKYQPKRILESARLAANPWYYLSAYADSLFAAALGGTLDLSELAEWRAAHGALFREAHGR